MKTSRMMFYSDYISEQQLLKAVRNSSCLDKCYVAMYEKKWNQKDHERINLHHVNKARNEVGNLEFVLIREEDIYPRPDDTPMHIEVKCRNYMLDRAKHDGNDCILLQDTDEFLMREDYDFLFNDYYNQMLGIGCNMATIRCMTFWKNWNYMVVDEDGNAFQSTQDMIENRRYKLGSWKNFMLTLNSNLYFEDWDVRNSVKSWILYDVFLYHGSWILTDEEVSQKIRMWGHSTDATGEEWREWYEEVWLKWGSESDEISMKNKKFPVWKKAVPYQGKLPLECR